MGHNADHCPSGNGLSNLRTRPGWFARNVPTDWCWVLPSTAAVACAPTHAVPTRCSPCSHMDNPPALATAREFWALPIRAFWTSTPKSALPSPHSKPADDDVALATAPLNL